MNHIGYIMKKQLLILSILALFTPLAQAQEAQETPSRTAPPSPAANERIRLQERMEAQREAMQERRDTMMGNQGSMMKEPAAAERRGEMMQQSKNGEENSDFSRSPEEVRARILEMREKFAERVEKFKDKKKQEISLRLQENFQKLNQRLSAHFLDIADTLDEITNRVETRAKKIQENGEDVKDVLALISKARTQITALRDLAKEQQEKVYDIKIQGESTARADFKKKRQQFFTDIEKLKDTAQTARVAIRKAVNALAELKSDGTPSPIASPAIQQSEEDDSETSN